MNELSERQKTLLLVIIRDYIDAAQPVGSKRLVDRYHLDLSSATIRHEMAELTEMGYLRQPHTSAGRVPTEEGYRLFVSEMMNQAVLPQSVQNTIAHQFHQARPGVDHWMHLAASVLAHQSQGVSMVTAPRAEKVRFQHVELISTQGRQILMVMVLVGGEVSQQLLTLAEPVSQERLSQTASRLNGVLVGLAVDELARLPGRSDALEQDILTLILAGGTAPVLDGAGALWRARTGDRDIGRARTHAHVICPHHPHRSIRCRPVEQPCQRSGLNPGTRATARVRLSHPIEIVR
jgi:heat-inducible transcriptional repressor